MEQELIFKNRIRMWRAEKRISQGDLAELVGVSRQTISSIENLQFCPSARLALLICVALEKTFEEVFYFNLEQPVPLKPRESSIPEEP
ncbi:helix-turn-helix transcriptional regulator [Faecalispora anaeroviscerum]|uniref:helix-turn-helix transcriptional regulator n=1 Tax=Faecalispora anaeroviscerum TaxID=2991836 RepID=UPI0024BB2EBE|nr:helix-turn-helix transcriptional regulator [Faecalispora anaeroviscerum]